MASGKIKFYLHKQGYGFIIPDDGGPDRFFHKVDLPTPDLQPLEDQRVVYDANDAHPKGKRASNVRLA
jgi:cold shock CspA family protein